MSNSRIGKLPEQTHKSQLAPASRCMTIHGRDRRYMLFGYGVPNHLSPGKKVVANYMQLFQNRCYKLTIFDVSHVGMFLKENGLPSNRRQDTF